MCVLLEYVDKLLFFSRFIICNGERVHQMFAQMKMFGKISNFFSKTVSTNINNSCFLPDIIVHDLTRYLL